MGFRRLRYIFCCSKCLVRHHICGDQEGATEAAVNYGIGRVIKDHKSIYAETGGIGGIKLRKLWSWMVGFPNRYISKSEKKKLLEIN